MDSTAAKERGILEIGEAGPVEHCEGCGQALPRQGYFMQNEYYPNGVVVYKPGGGFDPRPCFCAYGQAQLSEYEKAKRAEQDALKKAEAAQRISVLQEQSGMQRMTQGMTFEAYKVDAINSSAYHASLQYAENFDAFAINGSGMLFIGSPGVGKTHLASAIANHLIGQEKRVYFTTFIDLLARIRDTYNSDTDETDYRLLNMLKTMDLLVIDDLGKEIPNDWAMTMCYQIIDGRVKSSLPIVVTSNYTPDELSRRFAAKSYSAKGGDTMTIEAIMSRLIGSCLKVDMQGMDRRTSRSWR